MPRGGVDDIPETHRLSELEVKLLDALQLLTFPGERVRLTSDLAASPDEIAAIGVKPRPPKAQPEAPK